MPVPRVLAACAAVFVAAPCLAGPITYNAQNRPTLLEGITVDWDGDGALDGTYDVSVHWGESGNVVFTNVYGTSGWATNPAMPGMGNRSHAEAGRDALSAALVADGYSAAQSIYGIYLNVPYWTGSWDVRSAGINLNASATSYLIVHNSQTTGYSNTGWTTWVETNPVPLPGAALLLGSGLAGLAAWRRRVRT